MIGEKMTRNELIYIDRNNGMTLSEISIKYGISVERVRQICAKVERKKSMTEHEIKIEELKNEMHKTANEIEQLNEMEKEIERKIDEIKNLKEKKKEIERRIREEKNQLIRYGSASIAKKEIYGDQWALTIRSKNVSGRNFAVQERAIVYAKEKEEIINSIQGVIDDLEGLKKEVEKEKE